MATEPRGTREEGGALRAVLPYVLGLLVAAGLYYYAAQIDYTARPGTLGPDFWPKLCIGLLAVACLWEIGRLLLAPRAEATGLADALEEEREEDVPTSAPLLIGGILLVGAYAVLVPYLGFLLGSFLFLAAFMYLGRYRNHRVIWVVALAITLAGALIFMRFAYVSLPRGVYPFDHVTDFVRVMLGG